MQCADRRRALTLHRPYVSSLAPQKTPQVENKLQVQIQLMRRARVEKLVDRATWHSDSVLLYPTCDGSNRPRAVDGDRLVSILRWLWFCRLKPGPFCQSMGELWYECHVWKVLHCTVFVHEGPSLSEADLSISHVIQQCPRSAHARTKRHDAVLKLLSTGLTRKGFTVEVEPAIKTDNGVRRPDVVAYKPGSIRVLSGDTPHGASPVTPPGYGWTLCRGTAKYIGCHADTGRTPCVDFRRIITCSHGTAWT